MYSNEGLLLFLHLLFLAFVTQAWHILTLSWSDAAPYKFTPLIHKSEEFVLWLRSFWYLNQSWENIMYFLVGFIWMTWRKPLVRLSFSALSNASHNSVFTAMRKCIPTTRWSFSVICFCRCSSSSDTGWMPRFQLPLLLRIYQQSLLLRPIITDSRSVIITWEVRQIDYFSTMSSLLF